MAKLNFKIITPERVVLSEQADALICPTTTGQITILPGHIPLISILSSGELAVRVNNQMKYIAVSGGFIEIRPGNEVIILADSADHDYEIDLAAAEEARQRAQESMKQAVKISSEEYAVLVGRLQKSLARLKVAKRHAHTGKHAVTSEGLLKE